jgi:hypothetical protein
VGFRPLHDRISQKARPVSCELYRALELSMLMLWSRSDQRGRRSKDNQKAEVAIRTWTKWQTKKMMLILRAYLAAWRSLGDGNLARPEVQEVPILSIFTMSPKLSPKHCRRGLSPVTFRAGP